MPSGPATAVGTVDSARALTRTPLDTHVEGLGSQPEILTSEVALAHRPGIVALIVVAWMGLGFLGAVIMARRGHDFRPLAGLAVVFGPLFAGFVVANLRPRERGTPAIALEAPADLGGDHDVAVLVLGDTSEAVAAAEELARIATTLRHVEVIRPITYETADGSGEIAVRERADADARAAGAALAAYRPGLTLLPGTTARAMSDHIEQTGPHLVLIVGDPALEAKLDHRTTDDVRVVSVPATPTP